MYVWIILWNCKDLRVECMDVYPKLALEPASFFLLKLTIFDLVFFYGNQRVAPQNATVFFIPEFLGGSPWDSRGLLVESLIHHPGTTALKIVVVSHQLVSATYTHE